MEVDIIADYTDDVDMTMWGSFGWWEMAVPEPYQAGPASWTVWDKVDGVWWPINILALPSELPR